MKNQLKFFGQVVIGVIAGNLMSVAVDKAVGQVKKAVDKKKEKSQN